MFKKVLYWAPCLNKVGTYYSTINSAIALQKYSRSNFKPVIINVCGEWNDSEILFKENDIEVIKFCKKNYFKFLPKDGFLKSRLSYIVIILLSIMPLVRLLIKNKDNLLIIHLLTSLPLILKYVFNLKIKMILRISGYPRLNYFRKKLWKYANQKLEFITCPTIDLSNQIKEFEIFDKQKIIFLPDAIINIKTKIKDLRLNKKSYDSKTILAVGRFTKQKNFLYLIKEFQKFLKKKDNYKLIILGDGENKIKIEKFIKEKNISNNVLLKGHVENVYNYMKNSDLFVLSSLWEDPGFVIIEAAFCNLFVVASNCPNGPIEFLENGKNGILFESNKEDALLNSLIKFDNLEKSDLMQKKINLKKNTKKYSIFRHYLVLSKIIKQVNF